MERRQTLKETFRADSGMVFVEASIIFTIMFFILFFLIFMGNAFHERAKVDELIAQKAIEGAAYCADPVLVTIHENNGVFPDAKTIKIQPYRYLFGRAEVESLISSEVVKSINGGGEVKFFKDMDPAIVTSPGQIAKFHNYVVYSTFSVELTYKVQFPIRFFGSEKPTLLTITSRAEAPVDDAPEFIRNTDMVVDFLSGTKFGQKIAEYMGKVNKFLEQFAGL